LRLKAAVLLRQLMIVVIIGMLGVFSGYVAAASGPSGTAAGESAPTFFTTASPPVMANGATYRDWLYRLFGQLLGFQGALREEPALDRPAVTINRDVLIGQVLGDKTAIGPAVSAPITTRPTAVHTEESAASWRPREYKVGAGDTLSGIARRFGLQPETLVDVNLLSNPDLLVIGRVLVIPPTDGKLYEVQEGDVLWAIADRFQVDIADIIDANELADPAVLYAGEALFIPGAAEAEPAVSAIAAGSPLREHLLWPVAAVGRISSPFGPRMGTMHTGVDIAVPRGTAITAAARGRVVAASWLGAYGRAVVLTHPRSGWKTLYAHALRLVVSEGQWVTAGQTIGYVGTSGRSTGPHLHFEVIIDGQPRDPLQYLDRDQ